MKALWRRVFEILGELSTQNVANTTLAFAKMEVRPEALMEAHAPPPGGACPPSYPGQQERVGEIWVSGDGPRQHLNEPWAIPQQQAGAAAPPWIPAPQLGTPVAAPGYPGTLGERGTRAPLSAGGISDERRARPP